MTALNDIFRKGLALHQAGRSAEAQALYRQVLAAAPRHFDALHLLGLTLVQSGEAGAGIRYIREALGVRSDVAEAHYNLGHALLTTGNPADALASFETALSLKSDEPHYHLEAGNALKELKRPAEAIARYDEAIRLDPGAAEAFNNRAIALKDDGRPAEALASFEAAIALRPRYAEAHSNMGNAMRDLGRLDEALACHDRAIALRPGYAEAHYNRGNVLAALKRVEPALESYDEAIRLRPAYGEAQHNKALLLLGCGRFREGFALYHWRWQSPGFAGSRFRTSIAAWDGRPGPRRLLLWGEQGIGDEIFHASLLSLLRPGEMDVTIAADRRLHAIYARSFPDFALLDGEALRDPLEGRFDAQAPLADLGALLALDEAGLRERRMPFLLSDPARRNALRAEHPLLFANPVCGLSWKSSNKKFGANKSLRLIELAPLLTLPGIRFVNLQYGDVSGEIAEVQRELGIRIHEIDGLDIFNDIDGLLALVDCCDGVLTTSSITAHLAGGLGKRGAVLVPAGKGLLWYWQGGANNLWYPSLHRIGQERAGQWDFAIRSVGAWLKDNL